MTSRVGCSQERRGIPKLNVKLAKDAGLSSLCSQSRRFTFQDFAQLEQLSDVVKRDIGDDNAATAGSLCKTLGA